MKSLQSNLIQKTCFSTDNHNFCWKVYSKISDSLALKLQRTISFVQLPCVWQKRHWSRRLLPFLAHFPQTLCPPPQSHGHWRSHDVSAQSCWLFLALFPKSRVSSHNFKEVAAAASDFKRSRSLWQAPRHVWIDFWWMRYHQNMFIVFKTRNIICFERCFQSFSLTPKFLATNAPWLMFDNFFKKIRNEFSEISEPSLTSFRFRVITILTFFGFEFLTMFLTMTFAFSELNTTLASTVFSFPCFCWIKA